MKRILLIVCAFFFVVNVQAEKYGLIIAVGDYPRKTGWTSISSVNDVPLIQQALLNQKFKAENISVLKNEQATREGILNAIKELQAKIKEGDIVVIHYSGHGQQIFDNNGDELDSKDESLVPYDALVRYTSKYKGQNHIRDDELGNIIAQFRNALGKEGQLLMLLDSCHSGSASRGGKARGGEATFAPPNWQPTDGGDTDGSGLMETTVVNEDAAPFVMMSGASADELNYEYEGYGSLSFAFAKAMNDLGSNFTYRQLFSKIATNMNIISPNQTPTIEGDIDFKLFSGDYVTQQPYYEVKEILRSDVIKINGGKLQRLFKETTVKLLPAGTINADESTAITSGYITNSEYNEAIIKLSKPLDDTNNKAYWVFIDQPAYGDIAIKVYLDDQVTDAMVKDGVAQFLEENILGEVVTDVQLADIIVSKSQGKYVLNASKGENLINPVESSRGQSALDELTQKLFNYAQGNYLKNLSLKNYDYEFDFRLLPVEYDVLTNEQGAVGTMEENVEPNGIFTVNTSDDYVVLEISNKSEQPLYFSIVEINTQGEISPFLPRNSCKLTDDERKIGPGETKILTTCRFNFYPPEEILILKGFATSEPINFQPTVESRGEASPRANQNPLEKFLSNTYSQSRGSGGSEKTQQIDGFSTEFVYEIKDN